ncbi:hypothetical protein HBB16_20350 [Pseudonocardia sp. MCCB 268]|nr:hypothetical protein [Pseudonocardia cytotoxica]
MTVEADSVTLAFQLLRPALPEQARRWSSAVPTCSSSFRPTITAHVQGSCTGSRCSALGAGGEHRYVLPRPSRRRPRLAQHLLSTRWGRHGHLHRGRGHRHR